VRARRPAVVFVPRALEARALSGPGLDPVVGCHSPTRAVRHARAVALLGAGTARYEPHLPREAVRPGDLVVATEVLTPSGPVPLAAAPLVAAAAARAGARVHQEPLGDPLQDPLQEPEDDTVRLVRAAAKAGKPLAVLHVVGDPATDLRADRALRQARRVLTTWAAAIHGRTVLLAEPRSFCAGVERAIEVVERALARYGPPVYVRRQIIHNSHVVADLEARGAVFVDEVEQAPAGSRLVFSAHGVSPAVEAAAERRGHTVIDATCPLVAKVHNEVRRFAKRDYSVVLVGHAHHDEVEGTMGERADIRLVSSPDDARTIDVADPERVAYVTQTTLALDDVAEVVDVLRGRFPSLVGPRADDVCYATQNRQDAVRAIAGDCDLVLVAGSPNSSNSNRLVEVANRAGCAAHLVDDERDVDLRWLAGAATVGVTAGASAPPWVVDRLVATLAGLGPVDVETRTVTEETVRFSLPEAVC
jgi:4-hydroxy-3-methylbut-2-enyl diphosphate reductase